MLRTLSTQPGIAIVCERPEFDSQGRWLRTVAEFVLASRPDVLGHLVAHIRASLQSCQFGDQGSIVRTCVALSESLNNALYHGNLELSSDLRSEDDCEWEQAVAQRLAVSPYKDRRIFVAVQFSQPELKITVRDEGPGFDPLSLPDPTSPDHLGHATGRGVFLVRSFMDEVRYNAAGNEVTLIKRAG